MANEMQRHGSSEGEVSNCVSNLIHAFTNGLDIFKRLRERRRKRKHRKHNKTKPDPASNAELQLSNSLRRGPLEIQSSYEQHYRKAGDRFAKGDGERPRRTIASWFFLDGRALIMGFEQLSRMRLSLRP